VERIGTDAQNGRAVSAVWVSSGPLPKSRVGWSESSAAELGLEKNEEQTGMNGITRRRFLTVSTAAIAASVAGGLLQSGQAQAAPLKYEPEKGATLRVLRWKRFVQGDEDQLLANTRRFTELTGVKVRIDSQTGRSCVPQRPWTRRR
jgi:hypothetical protein